MEASIADPLPGQRLSDEDWQACDTAATLPARATLTGATKGHRELRLPFGRGKFVLEIVRDSPAWMEPTIQSLLDLLQLGPGWDSYGGNPIDPNCVVAAFNLACTTFRDDTPTPSVVPTSGGGAPA